MNNKISLLLLFGVLLCCLGSSVLGLPYDVNTAVMNNNDYILTNRPYHTYFSMFGPDGNTYIQAGDSTVNTNKEVRIVTYTLGTPYDISTITGNTYVDIPSCITPTAQDIDGVYIKSDGSTLYLGYSWYSMVAITKICEYSVTDWNFNTASFVKMEDTGEVGLSYGHMMFAGDGTRVYARGSTITYDTLSTPWDIDTLSKVKANTILTETKIIADFNLNTTTGDFWIESIDFDPTGHFLYLGTAYPKATYQYYLPNAWIINSSIEAYGSLTYIYDLSDFIRFNIFNDDGSRLIVNSNYITHQYDINMSYCLQIPRILAGVSINNENICNITFYNSDIDGSTIDSSIISSSDVNNSTLTDSNISDGSITDSNINNCNLTDVNILAGNYITNSDFGESYVPDYSIGTDENGFLGLDINIETYATDVNFVDVNYIFTNDNTTIPTTGFTTISYADFNSNNISINLTGNTYNYLYYYYIDDHNNVYDPWIPVSGHMHLAFLLADSTVSVTPDIIIFDGEDISGDIDTNGDIVIDFNSADTNSHSLTVITNGYDTYTDTLVLLDANSYDYNIELERDYYTLFVNGTTNIEIINNSLIVKDTVTNEYIDLLSYISLADPSLTILLNDRKQFFEINTVYSGSTDYNLYLDTGLTDPLTVQVSETGGSLITDAQIKLYVQYDDDCNSYVFDCAKKFIGQRISNSFGQGSFYYNTDHTYWIEVIAEGYANKVIFMDANYYLVDDVRTETIHLVSDEDWKSNGYTFFGFGLGSTFYETMSTKLSYNAMIEGLVKIEQRVVPTNILSAICLEPNVKELSCIITVYENTDYNILLYVDNVLQEYRLVEYEDFNIGIADIVISTEDDRILLVMLLCIGLLIISIMFASFMGIGDIAFTYGMMIIGLVMVIYGAYVGVVLILFGILPLIVDRIRILYEQ